MDCVLRVTTAMKGLQRKHRDARCGLALCPIERNYMILYCLALFSGSDLSDAIASVTCYTIQLQASDLAVTIFLRRGHLRVGKL